MADSGPERKKDPFEDPKRDLFTPTGELKGGYDMGMARAYALDHAKKTQGEHVGKGRERRLLVWEVESSRFDEDAECWEIVLSCAPEKAQVEQKGVWVYHVRAMGGLMPGTPIQKQSLRYSLPQAPKRGGRPLAYVASFLGMTLLGGTILYLAVLWKMPPGNAPGPAATDAVRAGANAPPPTTPTPPLTRTPTPGPTLTPSQVGGPTPTGLRPSPVPTRLPVSAPSPTASPAAFVQVGTLMAARYSHTATLLRTGEVLIIGGIGVKGIPPPELFDPGSGKSATTGALMMARVYHTATLLPDGKVLVAGGQGGGGPLGTAELYNPVSNSFTYTGKLNLDRAGHTATMLTNGKVLIAGGNDAVAELYDPSTGTFSITGSLRTARQNHTATSLPNGKVVLIGGRMRDGAELDTIEMYDPSTGAFAPAGKLKTPRAFHTATLLNDGKVLVRGGFSSAGSSAELYDPSTGTTSVVGGMLVRCMSQTATLLPTGEVLIAGHCSDEDPANYAELYNPLTRKFSPTSAFVQARSNHTAVPLSNGAVLLIGGQAGGGPTASVEMYRPARGISSTPTPTPALPFLGALPTGDLVAFESGMARTPTIYLANLDGSIVSPLVEGYATSLDWSPDGQRIAFTCVADYPIWTTSDICVVSKDGTGLVNLTANSGGGYSPKWSPKGGMIAFLRRDGTANNWADIFVMNEDGTNLRNMTKSADNEELGSWSPDGKRFILIRERPGTGYRTSMVMDVGTATASPLVVEGKTPLCPSWSPDGQWMLFGYGGGIFKVRLDGAGLTQLSSLSYASSCAWWSPDGKNVAFVARRDGIPNSEFKEVYIVRADGTGLSRLTSSGEVADSQLAWFPDGKKIAYVRQRANGNDTYVVQVDGSGESRYWAWPAIPKWQPTVELGN